MGVINSGMVGRLGTQALGAVSVASISVSLCVFLFSFLIFLTTPEIALAVVQKRKHEVREWHMLASDCMVMHAVCSHNQTLALHCQIPDTIDLASMQVSRISARSLWVAAFFGVTT